MSAPPPAPGSSRARRTIVALSLMAVSATVGLLITNLAPAVSDAGKQALAPDHRDLSRDDWKSVGDTRISALPAAKPASVSVRRLPTEPVSATDHLWKPTIDALDPLLGVRFCNWCALADDGAQTEAMMCPPRHSGARRDRRLLGVCGWQCAWLPVA